MKTYRNPPDVHPPLGGYSHQVEINGPERMLVLSGQVGRRADGSVPDDPLEQIDIALENIFRNLHAADMGVQDLVKLIFYVAGEVDTAKRRELVAARLGGHQPAMTLVFVAGLASPIYRVEIDAWASRELGLR